MNDWGGSCGLLSDSEVSAFLPIRPARRRRERPERSFGELNERPELGDWEGRLSDGFVGRSSPSVAINLTENGSEIGTRRFDFLRPHIKNTAVSKAVELDQQRTS